MSSAPYDLAVIGGGIMGSAAAVRAAKGGMRTALLDMASIGSAASGVNAGTLSLQIKRVALMPYALKGYECWRQAGNAVGFHRTGGFTLAFSAREADLLTERMELKRRAGAPIEIVSAGQVRSREPALTDRIVAASFCAADGFANSSLTGTYYRALLNDAGVALMERTAVTGIAAQGTGYLLQTSAGPVGARRILIAAGAWIDALASMIGSRLPLTARINTVSVLERGPPVVGSVIGHATGLLTLKQKPNGSILIGGGWQGTGTPAEGRGRIDAGNLLTNLRLARFAVPDLAPRRVLRSWTGFEAHVPDFYPLAGRLPGHANAFVLGCVRGGYTIGPYIGRLVGDLILDGEPELPLFDPGRFDAVSQQPLKQTAQGSA